MGSRVFRKKFDKGQGSNRKIRNNCMTEHNIPGTGKIRFITLPAVVNTIETSIKTKN